MADRIKNIKPYAVESVGDVARLHLNEMRGAHAYAVVESVSALLGDGRALTEYEVSTEPLARALAAWLGGERNGMQNGEHNGEHNGIAPENIVCGAGSDEVLRSVIDVAWLSGIRWAIYGVPTYSQFTQMLQIRGIERVEYAYPSPFEEDPPFTSEMLEPFEELLVEGALVYLGNPNNPTGGLSEKSKEELHGGIRDLFYKYPKSLFIIDEAYVEYFGLECFNDKRSGASAFAHFHSRPAIHSESLAGMAVNCANVIVARTFSKMFGLAGLRVGYAVGNARIMSEVRKVTNPKSVTRFASTAAQAVLADVTHYERMAEKAIREKRRMQNYINRRIVGAVCPPGQKGNFLLIHVGHKAPDIVSYLLKSGYAVRDRSSMFGLSGFIRVTIGTQAENNGFTRQLKAAVEAAHAKRRRDDRYISDPAPPPIQALYAPKRKHLRLQKMFKTVAPLLAEAGVVCWLDAGSLLGAVRAYNARCAAYDPSAAHDPSVALDPPYQISTAYSFIMPWDDDIDLGTTKPMHDSCWERLSELLHAKNLILQPNRTGAYWQIGENGQGEPISPTHIDIFIYAYDPAQELYVNTDPRFTESAPGECNFAYHAIHLCDMTDIAGKPQYAWSEGIPVPPVPNHPEQLLDKHVPGWRDMVVVRDNANVAPGRFQGRLFEYCA